MSKKKNSYRPQPVVEALAARPLLGRWALLFLGACFAHALAAAFIGLEADSSTEVLLVTMIAAFSIGVLAAATKYNALETLAAAAVPPGFFAKWHWYWKADMHSPAGSAQSLVEWLLGWTPPPPAHYALALVLGGTGLIGWILTWINMLWEKKTGRPLISLEE